LKVVFLVTRSDNIGGSHIHVRDLVLSLKKEGHEIDVIIGGNGPVIEHYKNFGILPIVIPALQREISPLKDYRAYKAIKEKIEELKPDLISTHSSKAGFLGRIAAHQKKIPSIFTAHGWSFTTGKKSINRYIYRKLEDYAASLTTKIITVSDYDKKLAIKHLSIDEDKVITIHNGMMDIEPEFIAMQNHEKNRPVQLVKIARYDHQKDHIEFLKAVKNFNNIEINFVGDGPLFNQVKNTAETFNLSHKIKYWGRVESVKEILSDSDIFVLISNWEGFPRSTLEAMRAGLPTIVSDVGGASEAVEHGKTGFVVQKGDINSLKKYLGQLISNESFRREMGKNARYKFERSFTFDMMYQKTKKVYQEILIK